MSTDYIRIYKGTATRNGQQIARTSSADPAEMYRALGFNYPKFFKMDKLCKWSWLAAEALLQDGSGNARYEGIDKRHVAVVMASADGCLEVDGRYDESRKNIASPALFVYTLPNIALGEICIRHGFMGEQLCRMDNEFDTASMLFWVNDLVTRRGVSHCLFGWADSVADHHDICLFWADASSVENLSVEMLESVYQEPFAATA